MWSLVSIAGAAGGACRRKAVPPCRAGSSCTMGLSHPRRQQLRRLRKASRRAVEASLALAGAAVAADAGALALAILAGIVGVGLLGDGVFALRRAARSRVGAVSEARVRRAIDTLRAEGWRVAHGVSWRGRGDIDHV